ncbi:hypothetical protein DPMN_029164 [Dreissena polymorpha]|uniref:Uncharacterized protein n=1 Tax=Dreissena polymorpha TaxID=45954 RepID=A0A9D4M0A0_DREPO|nr:hypothetical protein DPMN_029164 [Dreissena polymorpha]
MNRGSTGMNRGSTRDKRDDRGQPGLHWVSIKMYNTSGSHKEGPATTGAAPGTTGTAQGTTRMAP